MMSGAGVPFDALMPLRLDQLLSHLPSSVVSFLLRA